MKINWERVIDIAIKIIGVSVAILVLSWGFRFLYEIFKVIFEKLF